MYLIWDQTLLITLEVDMILVLQIWLECKCIGNLRK